MEPTACDAAATECSTPAVSECVVAPSTPAVAALPPQGRSLAAEVRMLDGARWVKLPQVSWQDDPAQVEEQIKLTVSAVTADAFNKILLPADITAAEKLQTDEKEHLREMHNELQVRGWPLTSYAAHWALAEHRHVKKVISQFDTDGEGNLNAENLLQGAPEMHEDEREHLLESLKKREARGEKLTAHQVYRGSPTFNISMAAIGAGMRAVVKEA
ncbi:hypothetical protein CYMTET_28946 [Cymbomonas tetramitiformis]|uniref:EF-hand domain-containing protein n=1 Tax=Cymbomonas tetramitiformis TaxID=36881 RepID=A0AAE0FMG2_9CHLO|nr:hypothetical protein CYMTET_28946 [Cymbomonas tetramitiformis]